MGNTIETKKTECYDEVEMKKRHQRAAELVEMMMEDQEMMAVLLVGLISADNNREEEEIQKNKETLQLLYEGSKLVIATDETEDKLNQIKDLIEKGLMILKQDLERLNKEEVMLEVLGNKMYEVRDQYHKYFDASTISHEAQKEYIYQKFGECKEPTYDPLWRVWYLGDHYASGELFYHIGSAQEILGMVVDCQVRGNLLLKKDGKVSSSCSGSLDFLIGEVWETKEYGYEVEFDEKDLLSPKQQLLVQKILEYDNGKKKKRWNSKKTQNKKKDSV